MNGAQKVTAGNYVRVLWGWPMVLRGNSAREYLQSAHYVCTAELVSGAGDCVREACGAGCEADLDRLISYPDVRYLSGCVLEAVGGAR